MKYKNITLRNEKSDEKSLENIPQKNNDKTANESKKKITYSYGFACPLVRGYQCFLRTLTLYWVDFIKCLGERHIVEPCVFF